MSNQNLDKLIGFLLGENEYDGVWFGENHPDKPAFWWRKELREAIAQETKKIEKAYGGCRKCYGKGYSTVRAGETYRGRTHNMRNQIKFCVCDRGKQLEVQTKKAEVRGRIAELWNPGLRIPENEKVITERIKQLEAELQAQPGSEK